MEKTLNLPDELADRLSGRDDQLARILELGLRIVEHEADGEEADDDELPPAWRGALAEVMDRRRQVSRPQPPEPEELVAYHLGELDPAEKEKWLERSTLDPEAVRDLLALIEFDRGEAPSARESEETAEALRGFRARLGRDDSTSRRYRWLAAAAVLVAAVGASWVPWLLDGNINPSGPRYATVIDVAASRGARPFPLSEEAQDVLLILPLEVSIGIEQATLRITAADGDLVYQDTLQMTDDRWSRLYLSLPRDRLGPGVYRIEVTTSKQAWEYRFAIEAPR